MKKSYLEKLKDPRWQKKRLEILERDSWCCQKCFDCDSTLHVHHRVYFNNKDPWDIDNEFLVTLCKDCHTEESETFKQVFDKFSNQVKKNYFSCDIASLSSALNFCKIKGPSDYIAAIIEYWLTDEELAESMKDTYHKHLKEKRNGEAV